MSKWPEGGTENKVTSSCAAQVSSSNGGKVDQGHFLLCGVLLSAIVSGLLTRLHGYLTNQVWSPLGARPRG